jgi:metallo-beta-lactamase family protein
MSKKLKLTFHGGTGMVTGANFLLEHNDTKILIDCGLIQGTSFSDNLNRTPFAYDPAKIQYLIVTHSHIDHIGRIPKLVKDGFRGKIISTPATASLTVVMLDDAVKVMADEARHNGVLPLYDKEDVEAALKLWQPLPYHENFNLTPEISFVLKDAGHILGSAMVEISYNKRKIVFTGDLGNTPSLILRDTEVITDADYLVMESVYGDRNHESREERRIKLYETLKESINKKKTILIPVFSLERTQEMLYELNEFTEKYDLPSVPVFLDSPLALRVTDIYRKFTEDFNEFARTQIFNGDDIFKFPRLKLTRQASESQDINNMPNPKIIMAGSGMSNGGRILNHERHFLPLADTMVILVGYQAVGTLGRQIQDGVKQVTINGEELEVRASRVMINGYSAHKDSDHLVDFVFHTAKKLLKVFPVMGENKSSMFLAQRLKDELGINATLPQLGQSFDLEF